MKPLISGIPKNCYRRSCWMKWK